MAVLTKHGTFRITGTGVIDVGEIGFDAYAIIFTATETADENFNSGICSGFGAWGYNPSTKTYGQFGIGWGINDNVTTTATRSGSGWLSSCLYLVDGSGTIKLRASNKYPVSYPYGQQPVSHLQLNVTTYSSSVGFTVNYMAIGGDVKGAHVSSFTIGTANGMWQNVQTKLNNCGGLIAVTTQETSSSYVNSAHARPSFGFWSPDGKQNSMALYSRSAAADSSEFQLFKEDNFIAGLNNSSSEAFSCTLEGFTNHGDYSTNYAKVVTNKASGTAHRVYYIALEGCDSASFLDISSGDNIESLVAGYSESPNKSDEIMLKPSGIFALSFNNKYANTLPDRTLAARSDHNKLSIGMTDGLSASSIWHGAEDGLAVTQAKSKASGYTTKDKLVQYNSPAGFEVADVGLGRFDNTGYTLDHSPGVPTNLLLNGDFEANMNGVNPTGFTPSRVTTWSDSGSYSLRLVDTLFASDGQITFDELNSTTITPGETYHAKCRVNVTSLVAAGMKFGIRWYNSGGSLTGSAYTADTTATGIYDFYISGVAPANTAYAKATFYVTTASTVDFLVDNIQLIASNKFGIPTSQNFGFLSFIIGEPTRSKIVPAQYSSEIPDWRFRLADSATFEDIVELTEARQRQLQLFLNKPGALSFELPLESAQALKVKSVTTCVKAYRDGELVWSGPVWTIQDSAPSDKTIVNCVGWLELLNHKVTDTEISASDMDASGLAFLLWYYSLREATSYRIDAPYSSWSVSGTTSIETIYPLSVRDGEGWNGFSVDVSPLLYNGTIDMDNIDLTSSESSFSYTDSYRLVLEAYSAHQISNLNVNFDIHDGSALYFDTGSYTSSYATTYEFPGNISSAPVGAWFRYYECNFELPGSLTVAAARAHIRATWAGAVDSVELKFRFKIEVIERVDDPFIEGFLIEPESTQLRTRTYPKFSNVGQEISALSEIEAGFDYQINPEDRGIEIYSRIGEERDILFAYNYGPDNIKSISTTTDPARMTNRFIATGQTVYETADDTDSQGDHGLFVELGSAPNTNESLILAAYANAEVALRSQPIVTYDLVPMPTTDYTPSPFADYSLGDVISFSASKGRIDIFNKKIRIFGISISIDDNGVESVTSLKTVAN